MSIELQRALLLSLEVAADRQQMAAEDDFFEDEMTEEDEMVCGCDACMSFKHPPSTDEGE